MNLHETIIELIRTHCLVDGVDVLPRGLFRAGTKLQYLDGSNVDVFLEGTGDLLGTFTLSDMGQTFAKLAEYGIKPKERKDMVQEAIEGLKVRRVKDQLQVRVTDGSVKGAVIDLAQACVRVSCIAFTKRITQKRDFTNRVREVLEGLGRGFDTDHPYVGPYGKEVRVDYRFPGVAAALRDKAKRPVAILQATGNHYQANEVFSKWSDLQRAKVSDAFVTVYDETATLDHPEDLERLQDVSELVAASNRKGLAELLQVQAA